MTIELWIYHGDSLDLNLRLMNYLSIYPNTEIINYIPFHHLSFSSVDLAYKLSLAKKKNKLYLLILKINDKDFETYHGIPQSLNRCLMMVDKRIREMLDVITVIRT
jgi:hypothetical protein